MNICNKLLAILTAQQKRNTQSGKNCLSSIYINGILDLFDDGIHKKVKKVLNRNQIKWLDDVLKKKSWKLTSEFIQYINQFTENVCDRIKISILTHKALFLRIQSLLS